MEHKTMREPKSLQEAIIYFSNPDNCIDYLAVRRWPKGVICPTCGSKKVKFSEKRRTWTCSTHHAKREFSIKIGTVMEDSPIGLDKWLTTTCLATNCQNGISSYVEAGAAVCTDAHGAYSGLTEEYQHQVVDHAVQYVDGRVHTNTLENFWSLVKRGLHGTYVSVEPFHLFRYLDEQMFRFNNRKNIDDAGRFELVISQLVGKRLTFAELTGKVGETTIH